MASSSRERDFFRWIKLPLSIFQVEVPIRTRARHTGAPEQQSTAKVAMILPSEMLQALHAAGDEVSWFGLAVVLELATLTTRKTDARFP